MRMKEGKTGGSEHDVVRDTDPKVLSTSDAAESDPENNWTEINEGGVEL